MPETGLDVERRRVVTVFLQNRGRVLLLKRSRRVRTMQGRWAGISSYLEEGDEPVHRALQEIQEETGLSGRHVKLLRRGELVEAPDLQQPNVRWIVHPFLFASRTRAIRLNWEHEESRGILPQDLAAYETVPKLQEALESVLEAELRRLRLQKK